MIQNFNQLIQYIISSTHMQETLNAKIVIVGDGAIGKTCVMIRYTDGYFNVEYTPTIFDNKVKYISINDKIINLNLWDTAGQESYSQLRSIAYPNTDVFLIAFSVIEPSSFVNAKKVWFREVKNQVPTAKILFIGTKADLRGANFGQKQLSFDEITKNLKEELGCQYCQCSSVTGEGIQNLFTLAARIALEKQGLMPRNKAPQDLGPKKPSVRQEKNIGGQEKKCSVCVLI